MRTLKLATALVLASCNSATVHALALSIQVVPDSVVLRIGETRTLVATGYDASHREAPNLAFTWRSSNESAATVTALGVVTGVGAGEADVVATSGDTSGSAHVLVQADNSLTLAVTGSGSVTSTPAGIACTSAGGAACTARFRAGSVVSLAATPADGAFFSSWGGDCQGAPGGACTVTLSASKTASAAFVAGVTLTVALTGPGSVVSSPPGVSCATATPASCAATFAPGTSVSLTAAPGAHAVFLGYSGGGCGSAAACTVPLLAATTIGATFGATHDLTVHVAGSGTVHSSGVDVACASATCVATFLDSASLTLTAAAGAGYSFGAFSGDCTGSACTLAMSADRTVTATFTQPVSSQVVHTTLADFSAGTWSGYGSTVTGDGGGAVQLATGSAELLAGGRAPNLTSTQSSAAGAVWSGRIYLAGGLSAAGSPRDLVRSASFNADGTLSAFRDELPMPEVLRDQGMIGWNGRLYVGGGYNASASSHVYSAKVNADGTLAAWDGEPSWPDARNGVALAAWGNRVYAVSGSLNAGNIDGTVRSAEVGAGGRLGAWRSETALPGGTTFHALAHAGRLYSLGGSTNAGDSAAIYSVPVGDDGVLGAWRAETSYPQARANAGVAVWNGRIYAAGGRIPGGAITGQIISSAIAADGSLAGWRVESAAAQGNLSWFQAGIWNGVLALVGSDAGGTSYTFPINAAGAAGAAWSTTHLEAARSGHDTWALAGKLFAGGGVTGVGASAAPANSIVAASLASDGMPGSFAAAGTSAWFASGGQREAPALVNGGIYAFGDTPGSPGTPLFKYAPTSASGVGTWSAGSWPWGGTWIDGFDVVSVGTRIYVMGGEDYGCGVHAEVFYADTCDAASCAPVWHATTSLPGGRYQGAGAAWNGFVYHLGGRTTGCPNPPIPLSTGVYYAKANADGTLAAWSTATALPVGLQYLAGAEAWDGVLYVFGGYNAGQSAPLATVYGAPLNADGSLGAWSQKTALPGARTGNWSSAKWNGKLYLVGGSDGTAGTDTVFVSGAPSPAPRGHFFGSMDLGAARTLQGVSWTASPGGTLAVFLSTAADTGGFTSWTQATNGAVLATANVRYLRYRLDLAPDGSGASPVLYDLTATAGP